MIFEVLAIAALVVVLLCFAIIRIPGGAQGYPVRTAVFFLLCQIMLVLGQFSSVNLGSSASERMSAVIFAIPPVLVLGGYLTLAQHLGIRFFGDARMQQLVAALALPLLGWILLYLFAAIMSVVVNQGFNWLLLARFLGLLPPAFALLLCGRFLFSALGQRRSRLELSLVAVGMGLATFCPLLVIAMSVFGGPAQLPFAIQALALLPIAAYLLLERVSQRRQFWARKQAAI